MSEDSLFPDYVPPKYGNLTADLCQRFRDNYQRVVGTRYHNWMARDAKDIERVKIAIEKYLKHKGKDSTDRSLYYDCLDWIMIKNSDFWIKKNLVPANLYNRFNQLISEYEKSKKKSPLKKQQGESVSYGKIDYEAFKQRIGKPDKRSRMGFADEQYLNFRRQYLNQTRQGESHTEHPADED